MLQPKATLDNVQVDSVKYSGDEEAARTCEPMYSS